MMVGPGYYTEKFKDKSLQELVIERNKLIESLNRYENRKILNDSKEILPEDMVKPSPQTIYHCQNEYLKEITDLIIEKSRYKWQNIEEKDKKRSLKKSLNSKTLYDKLWQYKKKSREKQIDANKYIKQCLKIINKELKTHIPIVDDSYILGARQRFVLEEFEKYIKAGNYEGAYGDLEDFIGFQRIPIDITQGLKETNYICQIEEEKIRYMIDVLNEKLKV